MRCNVRAMPSRPPFTFLSFLAGEPACAVELHPANPAMWRTLCGVSQSRTSGAVVRGAKRCRECRAEVQRRGNYTPSARKMAGHRPE